MGSRRGREVGEVARPWRIGWLGRADRMRDAELDEEKIGATDHDGREEEGGPLLARVGEELRVGDDTGGGRRVDGELELRRRERGTGC